MPNVERRAKSGKIGDNEKSEISVAVLGPCEIDFKWKVSSSWQNDYLRFYVDGVELKRITGEVDWKLISHSITTPGEHVLKWVYDKDYAQFDGDDCGEIKDLVVRQALEECMTAKYVSINLSAGSWSSFYPVTYLDDIPSGGLPESYKFNRLLLRKIDAGYFLMGSPDDELGHSIDETQHQVTLTKGYYIGVCEVTQKQWELVMGNKPSLYEGEMHPVEKVSYDDIRGNHDFADWPASTSVYTNSFMGRLRAKTGLDFDLPTESQWEYACRAGTKTALNSGINLTGEQTCPNMAQVARYFGNAEDGKHAVVASYAPNAWGLYDMHGNVEEWCLDWFDDYPNNGVTNPLGPLTGFVRVIRGGNYLYDASWCRSASRYGVSASHENKAIGFRVAMQMEEKYMVFDLLSEADGNQVKKIPAVPSGGWTDEYKTSKLVLRKIKAGSFKMGSPASDAWHHDDQTQHTVNITKDYWIGVFEVTQKQWELVTGSNPSFNEGDARPVECVSWNDICANNVFWDQLFDKTLVDRFNLPTEAQWEYACRAGTTGRFNNGTSSITGLGRYNKNCNDGKGGYTGEHTTVGSYEPNAWGLYDMHGNVAEWCLDWYGAFSSATVSNPKGPNYGDERVFRGGAFGGAAADCTSFVRDPLDPDSSAGDIGFRLVINSD